MFVWPYKVDAMCPGPLACWPYILRNPIFEPINLASISIIHSHPTNLNLKCLNRTVFFRQLNQTPINRYQLATSPFLAVPKISLLVFHLDTKKMNYSAACSPNGRHIGIGWICWAVHVRTRACVRAHRMRRCKIPMNFNRFVCRRDSCTRTQFSHNNKKWQFYVMITIKYI